MSAADRPDATGRSHRRRAHRAARATPLPVEREGMAMTTVDVTRPVTGGVDTHLDVNVAAALDPIGGLLGVAEFPTTPAGNRSLVEILGELRHLEARRGRRHRLLRSGSFQVLTKLRRGGGRGRPAESPGPSAHRQVGPGRCHRGGPCRFVRQSPRSGQEPRWQRRGDQGARCRQALIAFDKDPDAQSDPPSRLHRSRRAPITPARDLAPASWRSSCRA